MHIGLETRAVTVAFPIVIFGVNDVDTSVGSENDPSVEDQFTVVPIPAITALKLTSSPLQITRSEIGSIVGGGLTTIVIVAEDAHSPGLGVNV